MYLWKTTDLVKDFKEGTLSEAERFKYFLLFVVFNSVILEIAWYISEPPSLMSILSSSLTIFIPLVGIIYCYKVNKQIDNRDFIIRAMCLGVPIGIRLIVVFIVIYSLFLITGSLLMGDEFDYYLDQTTWIDVLFTGAVEVAFYWRLSRNIRLISIE